MYIILIKGIILCLQTFLMCWLCMRMCRGTLFMYTLYTIKTWIQIRARSHAQTCTSQIPKKMTAFFPSHILNNIWPSVIWYFFLHATNKALSLCVTQLCLRDSFSLIMRFFLSFSQQTTRRKNNEHEKKNTEKVERWVTRENICTVCERVFGVYVL